MMGEGRGVAGVSVFSAPDPGLLALPKRDRVEALRRKMATIPGRTFEAAPVSVAASDAQPAELHPSGVWGGSSLRMLPTPPGIADLLPGRGLARGSIVSVSGAPSVLVSMLASVTAAGSHAALVGQPKLGLLAAVEMGCDLRKLSVISDPGSAAIDVVAILVDGIDLVVLGLGGVEVSPSRARAVAARIRTKGSVLLVTDGRWPGAGLHLATRVVGVVGLGMGTGRVSGIRVEVTASGRGVQPRSRRLELTTGGTFVGWSPVSEVRAAGALSAAL